MYAEVMKWFSIAALLPSLVFWRHVLAARVDLKVAPGVAGAR